jgi:hypothetical protein
MADRIEEKAKARADGMASVPKEYDGYLKRLGIVLWFHDAADKNLTLFYFRREKGYKVKANLPLGNYFDRKISALEEARKECEGKDMAAAAGRQKEFAKLLRRTYESTGWSVRNWNDGRGFEAFDLLSEILSAIEVDDPSYATLLFKWSDRNRRHPLFAPGYLSRSKIFDSPKHALEYIGKRAGAEAECLRIRNPMAPQKKAARAAENEISEELGVVLADTEGWKKGWRKERGR